MKCSAAYGDFECDKPANHTARHWAKAPGFSWEEISQIQIDKKTRQFIVEGRITGELELRTEYISSDGRKFVLKQPIYEAKEKSFYVSPFTGDKK